SIVLPTLENCDDCWHACVWTTIHEVEYGESSCSYGDSTPACRFVQGGEESSYSLAQHCRSFGDTSGNAFFQEVGTNVVLAYLNEGFLEGFRRCGSEGAPAECG